MVRDLRDIRTIARPLKQMEAVGAYWLAVIL